MSPDTPLHPPEDQANLIIPQERKRWSERIRQVGADQAYQEFKTTYAQRHFGIQHALSHLFGELIYEKEGIHGVAVCDSTFSFGCYHSFFGRAIAEGGTKTLSVLNAACEGKFGSRGTGCQHGIGHGILEYMGHQHLQNALDACTVIQQEQQLFGCTSGVFMEYNVPIIITATTSFVRFREFNVETPYVPCPVLPERFRSSCYHELGQWWDKFISYNKIGMLCGAVTNTQEQEACFRGVGNVAAPSSQYDVGETIKKCNEMPPTQARIFCREAASWSFFTAPEFKEAAHRVCVRVWDKI